MRSFSIFSIFFLFVSTALVSTHTTATYSTNQGQIKMTLALAITTSTGNNQQAKSTINTETNKVSFSIKIRDFSFDNYFVESAFKDSYLEASTYPEATFEGKFKTSIDWNNKNTQKVTVEGNMLLHGVKKPKTFTAQVTVISATQVKVTSDFNIKASDHKIDIAPSMFANGKDDIAVNLKATYQKK